MTAQPQPNDTDNRPPRPWHGDAFDNQRWQPDSQTATPQPADLRIEWVEEHRVRCNTAQYGEPIHPPALKGCRAWIYGRWATTQTIRRHDGREYRSTKGNPVVVDDDNVLHELSASFKRLLASGVQAPTCDRRR